MPKTILFILFKICFLMLSYAQHSLSGKVTDEKNNPLSSATVALMHPTDSTLLSFGITDAEGNYQIQNIKTGDYLMQFSYVGMETAYDEITVPNKDGEYLGNKILNPSYMDEVVVEAELIPIKFKSDTLEFDTKAFQTRPGASVEELLEKLPGVEVDESGNIKAKGEDVVKVLVDGKEFFDKDPKVATKNLPAEALDKVQVFDRKTDEAAFTGIDDGVRERTINLLLDEDHKKGYFGNITAGIGTDERFTAEGRLYRFSKKTQTAILGLYNNINEFGFTYKGNNQLGKALKV